MPPLTLGRGDYREAKMTCCASKRMKRLQILLSTYNGGRYLREQLESFRPIAQTWPYCVLIRDDGSTDDTRAILEQYAAEENISVVFGENVGLNESYGWLVRHRDPTCDYYAVSDQDDRWMEGKAETALELLSKIGKKEGPILFASRSVITDHGMRPIGITKTPARGLSFYNAMLQNSCPGHTMILNRELMVLVERYFHPDMLNFDWWVYLTAASFGKVIFSPKPTVYHRQHKENTVGIGGKIKGPAFFQRAVKTLRGDGRKVAKQLAAFWACTRGELPPAYQNELEAFLSGQTRIRMRLKYFVTAKAFRQSRLDTFLFRWAYLLGAYRVAQQ